MCEHTVNGAATTGIRASGIPYTLLSERCCTENYEQSVGEASATGSFAGAAGEGRSAVSRALATPKRPLSCRPPAITSARSTNWQATRSGPAASSPTRFARLTSKVITYETCRLSSTGRSLVLAAGPARGFRTALVDSDCGIADGELASDCGRLSALLGRSTTSIEEAAAHS